MMINCFNILNFIKSKFSFFKKNQLSIESHEIPILNTSTVIKANSDNQLEILQEKSVPKVNHPLFRKKRAKRKKPSVVHI